jgi:uncharacterized membrane protein (UPF0127 family)
VRQAFAALALLLWAAAAQAQTLEATIHTKRGDLPLVLEIAATPQARATGLMNRDHIGEADGMIFLFPEAAAQAFWMKNTRLPLDMLFVDASGTIVRLTANVPPLTLTPRPSGSPVLAVIELDGGRASRESIAQGDTVRYEVPPSLEIR